MFRINTVGSTFRQALSCYRQTNSTKRVISQIETESETGSDRFAKGLQPHGSRYLFSAAYSRCRCQPTHCRFNNKFANGLKVTSTNTRSASSNSNKEITKTKEKPYTGMTTTEKVREAGKDVTYTSIIVIGVGVTAFMFFAIFRELMSGESPTGVYKKAYKLCKKTTQITDLLGEPLKCYGEENRRGRRRHVRHHEYELNGVKHMRLKFYIEGPHGKGTVQLEVKKNAEKRYDYRYLFVELDNFPQRTIILADNR